MSCCSYAAPAAIVTTSLQSSPIHIHSALTFLIIFTFLSSYLSSFLQKKQRSGNRKMQGVIIFNKPYSDMN